ncbi:MAG: DUF1295 domain-containing protein [Ardenticatenaceae bacterium]|nr:DUF1295 domain-containing protein [Ardenticatenaceae bacterium]
MIWATYLWGFAAIMALMTAAWLVSIPLKNASIVDILWSVNFVVAAVVYFVLSGGGSGRALLVLILALVWAARLAIYLLWRNWGQGEDFRYQAFRQNFGPDRYWWFSFFQVFLLQGTLAWLISSSLFGGISSSAPLNWLDGLGVVVWLIGFAFEAGGDWQLVQFKKDPANKGKLLTRGFWRYTRHPNYFGDAAVWWGFAILAAAAGSYITILGAVIMTVLLLRVSGVSLLEKTLVKTKPGYEQYMAETSAFFPWFPKSHS